MMTVFSSLALFFDLLIPMIKQALGILDLCCGDENGLLEHLVFKAMHIFV
jgi:hypothetical protein